MEFFVLLFGVILLIIIAVATIFAMLSLQDNDKFCSGYLGGLMVACIIFLVIWSMSAAASKTREADKVDEKVEIEDLYDKEIVETDSETEERFD